MKSEATMPVRNTGPRSPLETANEARTANGLRAATPAAGADGARTRGASSDRESRPFEESMTQAMRRAQSKSSEARKSQEREAGTNEAGGTRENAAVAGEQATSPEAAPAPSEAPAAAQAASVVPTVPEDPEAADEAALDPVDAKATAANAASVVMNDAPAGRTIAASTATGATAGETPLPSTGRGTTASTHTGIVGEAAQAAGSGAASADASTAEEHSSAAADTTKPAAGDPHARSAGAEALAPRSTADFAAQLAQARGAHAMAASQPADAAGASASTANAAALHRSDLSTAVGDALFPGRFAAEVALLGSAGIERAEIRLQPRELGPVRVELSLNGESARIAFSAVQPETRQAIEQSLPILKEMLAERGLSLGEANVSDGRAEHGSADPRATPSHAESEDGARGTTADRPFAADVRHTPARRTLLDVYA